MENKNKDLKTVLADEGMILLKSDHISIGSRIPISNGADAIVAKETELSKIR